MQTYANTTGPSASVVDVDVRSTMLYLLAIATWRGMETILATILNTSQIKIYE